MPWVEIAEAAFTLGVSERTIRNWIKSGKLEARNSDGRREVNIPDSDEAGAGAAFDDDDEASLNTQKRLEVALIECGRVKGTLASQERMMESLSSNIAELNAKLQKGERTVARRTIWCLIIAFVGLFSILVIKYIDDATMHQRTKQHSDELSTVKDGFIKDTKSLQKEFEGKLSDKDKEQKQEIETVKTLKNQEKMKELKELDEKWDARHDKEMQRLRDDLAKLREELETEKMAKVRAEERLMLYQKDLSSAESQIELQKQRIEELEKTRAELEKRAK